MVDITEAYLGWLALKQEKGIIPRLPLHEGRMYCKIITTWTIKEDGIGN